MTDLGLSMHFGTSVHPSTQITLSRIGQYGNDALALGFGGESQLKGSMDSSTRGYADDEAFVTRELASCMHGLLRANLCDAIHNGRVVVLGYEVSSYALYAVRRGSASSKQGRLCRFYGNGLKTRIESLQLAGSTTQSTTSTYTCHEVVYLTVSIVPNLLCRSERVCLGIGWVGELTKNDGIGNAFVQTFCLGNGTDHTLCTWSENQTSTCGTKQLLTLMAHGVGHDDNGLITSHSGYPCQSYTSIATCRLYDGASGQKHSTALGIKNHIQCHTILDTTARVEIFKFCKHSGALVYAIVGRESLEVEQGSVTNQLREVVIYFCHNVSRI